MNMTPVVEELLLSHHISFEVNGGVQQFILAYTVVLHINPDSLMLDLNFANCHTFCSHDISEEKRELNIAYHYMLKSFRELYVNTVMAQ
jgi:hypothetical protein